MTENVDKVQYLLDRQEILDCMHRYARGVDRHDHELIRSVFHAEAIDNHGSFTGNVDEFLRWLGSVHDAHYASHTHNITSHSCEIDGNVAHAETYVIYSLRTKDSSEVRVGGGRYLDRLERRHGEWRILLRRMIVDWYFTTDGTPFRQVLNKGYIMGRWDRSDLSYMRPLEMEATETDPSAPQ
ncbi:nuclear transport factor 2 family protein [Mesorhizobium sp. CO1-1-8]|uniref:nuclear transport factor 2 family protein n=1 Tax=Mesorhizobium sp. CO1-1-8 TaxID=2876631 RepID=UPI001CD07711|nr:nuclear transport factor 2 family protein [Mesorhizobium sp. CO1-1-8]MBZ9772404.1 nuclear transport factor 2 family protein [Mesorhizobium sp. CO1-1-8]